MSFHVVCSPAENATNTSIAYANVVRDIYTFKQSDTSATVGLSVLGSLSLPIRSSNDPKVKGSSETGPRLARSTSASSHSSATIWTVPRSPPVPGDVVSSRLPHTLTDR